MAQSFSQYENADFVADAHEKAQEEKMEKAASLTEAQTLQERLERQLAEESIDVPIADEQVPFRPFDREASQFAAVLRERLENLEDHEDVEEAFDEAVDRIYAVAAEYSKPEFTTMQWWEDRFSVNRMILILTYVNVEGQPLDEDEAKK